MSAFTIRLDSELITRIDSLFPLLGFRSRNSFIEHLIEEAVNAGFVPNQKGEGYRANSPTGGSLSLIFEEDYISSGQHGLSSDELTIFDQVLSLVEDGRWSQAHQYLLQSNFQIEYITVKK